MRIQGYDHVGIRVSDAERTLKFYKALGFELDPAFSNDRVAEIVTADGTRINLIFNGEPQPEARNILLDDPTKLPGYTHCAFIVDSLQHILDWAGTNGVTITEGPVNWDRRLTCFLRDPDGNVLEFNELLDKEEAVASKPVAALVLHEYAASGNCYKVRLTAAHVGVALELREYDILKGETRTPEFLANVNRNGRIPVLQVGDRFIPESNAACYYLAEGSPLVPTARFEQADMLRWMFFEQFSHEPNIATVRFWLRYVGADALTEAQRLQLPLKQRAGNDALQLMDDHLSDRTWLVGHRLSLADICLFAYTHVAEEGDFSLSPYPAVERWLRSVAGHPAHVAA